MNSGINLPATEEVVRKNRRFQIARAIFFVLTGAVIIAILIFSLIQFSTNQRLVDTQAKTVKQLTTNSDQNTRQIADLQKHIDCIVALFQQPGRASFVITDIENCKLSNFTTGETTTGPSTSPSSSSSTTIILPSNSTKTDLPTASNEPTAQPEPVKVLGIPVCIPLTSVCVR